MVPLTEAGFWLSRNCFTPPIPELEQAADLLDQAAKMILLQHFNRARELILEADITALYAFSDNIERKQDSSIFRFRKVPNSPSVIQTSERVSP